VIAVAGGIVAAVCWGVAGTLSARGARASDAASATAWGAVGGAVALAPVLLVAAGPAPSGRWLGLAAITAVSTLLGNLCLFAALRRGPIALVAPVAALYGPEAALVSVARGEPLDPFTALAFALVTAGMVLVVGNRRPPTSDDVAHRPRQAVALALGASVLLGSGLVGATEVGGEIGGLWMLATVEILGALMFGLPLLIAGRLSLSPRAMGWCTLGSVTTSVGYLTYIAVSSRHGIAVPAILASQQCVVAAAVGIVSLGERVSRRQMLGGVLVAGAVALLPLSQLVSG
jgi:drug/metabolite transporter (DMT)-like permease